MNLIYIILVVDEATKMLEINIVTALTKCTDHLILIGDHNHSRPKNASEELAKKFKWNVSLFERFILNEMEYYYLEQTWATPMTYDRLLSHLSASAEQIEEVKGIIDVS